MRTTRNIYRLRVVTGTCICAVMQCRQVSLLLGYLHVYQKLQLHHDMSY